MAEHAATNTGPIQLNDATYDVLRRFVELIIPGLAAFYAAVALIWGWGYIAEVAGTAAAATVLGGVLLKFARQGYEPSKEVPPGGYDGKVVEDVNDEGLPVLRLELNATATEDIMNKQQLVIKGFDAGA
jgi:hypothetical protein